MRPFDFICENDKCEEKDKRTCKMFQSEGDIRRFKPVCHACKQELKHIPLLDLPKAARSIGPVIKGAFTKNTNEGFARGLTSTNPEDLKRDLKNGDFYN